MIINIFKFIAELLNNNIGVATFLVGFVAIYVYLKQKKDYKRDAANLILQEIRFAEQKIRDYKTYGMYQLSDKLLPTNNWNKNIHLFLNNLGENDVDLISRFYSKAEYIDILIGKISDFRNLPKNNLLSVPFTLPSPGPQNEQNTPINVISSIQVDPLGETQNILKTVSSGIENIYNTPVGEKLKSISKKKWYFLF